MADAPADPSMAHGPGNAPAPSITPVLSNRFVFPRWANYGLPAIVLAVIGGMFYMPVAIGLGGSPATTAVGYAPEQPVPYSHAVHVGKLGMDCRYCHTTVENASFAAIPPTQTCMNCHRPPNEATGDPGGVRATSPNLAALRESWTTGLPVNWVKVHDLPDYTFFNHSAHGNRGIGCTSCHGRIDQMDVVRQVAPLSMGWCLDCHREPEKHLRPKEQVTNMGYRAVDHPWAKEKNLTRESEAQLEVGRRLKEEYGIRDRDYMQSCYTCHR